MVKLSSIKGFPKHHKVKLFRVVVSTHRTDYVVTNDLTQNSTEATQEVCGFRWKIEQLHQNFLFLSNFLTQLLLICSMIFGIPPLSSSIKSTFPP